MDGNAVNVRPMTLADAGEVLTVQLAAFVREGQLYGDVDLPPLVESVGQVRADLEHGLGLVALVGTRVVGSVRVRVEGSSLHIGRLAVAPDLQGRGVGALLLARAEQLTGATEALLFTGHRSESNLRLYARAGYVELRRVVVDDRVTLVHLRKQLAWRVDR